MAGSVPSGRLFGDYMKGITSFVKFFTEGLKISSRSTSQRRKFMGNNEN
jgi:hypothetical protein